MALTREQVVWAYRMFLDREPESQQAVDHNMGADDVPTLRRTLLSSPEYAARNKTGLRAIGRYLNVRDVPVETDATDEQLRAMLARIEREWSRMGETEPHWSVLTSEAFKADAIADRMEEFYATGVDNLDLILNPLRRSGRSVERLGRVLDFGCGVGRLSLALAPFANTVLGVDISPGHIKLAERRARATGVNNAAFRLSNTIEGIDALPEADLIVSLIVLQHNPPPIQALLLEKLLGRLAAGGAAVFQLLTMVEQYRFSAEDYLAAAAVPMEMNALPQHVVFDVIARAGCRVLEVREDNWIGDAGGVSQTFAVVKADAPVRRRAGRAGLWRWW